MPEKEHRQISLGELPFNFIFEPKIKSTDSHWESYYLQRGVHKHIRTWDSSCLLSKAS